MRVAAVIPDFGELAHFVALIVALQPIPEFLQIALGDVSLPSLERGVAKKAVAEIVLPVWREELDQPSDFR